MEASELGVNQVAERVHLRLQRYLEAQYHIRDTGVIEERKLLLEEPGAIAQRPFVEVTPSYASAPGFVRLRVPDAVRALLVELGSQKPGLGVFPPYVHQAEALEAFFGLNEGEDLIVATGTGSGKTETFLYTVLGLLALEGTTRPQSFARSGVRTLLLYPMNALVSDQTARLRRMVGDERLANLFRAKWGRHPRFGMYTSRTPYPGTRTGGKDTRNIEPLLEYYAHKELSAKTEDQQLVRELKQRGRWPAKDIVGFFAEQEATYTANNKKQRNWHKRLITQPGDRELLTRHEMQWQAPDLLVTNYSMLEYMLLRPIERPIFQQTKAWLDSDKRNQLLLVLDEAHMYRGVGGAEVGLLIRRLQSRLGIKRDRLRCILTSASLGSTAAAIKAGQAFAEALTGRPTSRLTKVITGTREKRSGAAPGDEDVAKSLAGVDPRALASARVDLAPAQEAVAKLARALRWGDGPPTTSTELELRQYVGTRLTGFGPLELLIVECAGDAKPFDELALTLFPSASQELAESATDGLLALGSFSRRSEQGRTELPLLPTRAHMLFRGLPPVYACVNENCTKRRHAPGEKALVGRLYNEPLTHCDCGSRVFELLTHRDCGAAFLRAHADGPTGDFLWHERGGILSEFGSPLHEVHIYLETPHRRFDGGDFEPLELDITTGRLSPVRGAQLPGFRIVSRPTSEDSDDGEAISSFAKCPACLRPTGRGRSRKIMDLATKGEQPFANLIREQFACQLPTARQDDVHPNEGRKALLFSDGRQKAARLARDLPREVERDSFREALVLAADELRKRGKIQQLDSPLYAAFVAVCSRHFLHFFDKTDQTELLEEISRFRKDFDADLGRAFEWEWKPTPPIRYRRALLRQVCDPYYSLVSACAAVVEAHPRTQQNVSRRLGGLVSPEVGAGIARAWLEDMLSRQAFDHELRSLDTRRDEYRFFEPVQKDSQKRLFEDLARRTGVGKETLEQVKDELFEIFTRDGGESGRLLAADGLCVRLALEDTWLQCPACGELQVAPLLGGCANTACGEPALEPRPAGHPYMRTRKGYFREPLRAVLAGERPLHITAEEHTAQLSQRDAGVVYATTEEFELRFQDVPLGPTKPPVDVLSCTTTMEVGIDIGSLTAVGLRTVPPQRENYQQRAGRAGRRGTSVSTVLTFAQGGAHDAHYFANPHTIISGPPRDPRIKINNPRLARRHINSFLLQTYFHSQLDSLSADDLEALKKGTANIMGAFGSADDFYEGTGVFTLAGFESWMRSKVLGRNAPLVDEVVSWLPDQLVGGSDPAKAKRELVKSVAKDLLDDLVRLAPRRKQADEEGAAGESTGEDDDRGSLLDMLFDEGLLPAYAFPTDLCSFVIQEFADRQLQVKERPQLGKIQALSEYAPGRLLVVNKETYRVGGVFVEGIQTATPGRELFARVLARHISCPRCTYVRIEEGPPKATSEPDVPCPVCAAQLLVREMLDPPAFSPERGKPVREGDRDLEITFASGVQLPELVDGAQFKWQSGGGARLQHAAAEEVVLVVANKGHEGAGFTICKECGAAWLDRQEPTTTTHPRPFLVPSHVLAREGAQLKCGGELQRSVLLGHQFRSDILLLRVPVASPFDFSPEQPWLYDALATLAEAIALGASLSLDIDPGELSAGFRLVRVDEENVAEIFLFDTSSGGAGYSAEAGENLQEVLDQTERLLEACPGGCTTSCTKCLRHYGNRFLHARLDRRLGLQLLRYARHAEAPAITTDVEQAKRLEPLLRYLALEGWSVRADEKIDGVAVPLSARAASGGRAIAIGTYPSQLAVAAAQASHALAKVKSADVVLLPDYLVEKDLPGAHRMVVGRRAAPNGDAGTRPRPSGAAVNLPAILLKDFLGGGAPGGRTVSLTVPSAEGVLAIEVDAVGGATVGVRQGVWVVIRKPTKDELAGKVPVERGLLRRRKGQFRATGSSWTVANVVTQDDTGKLRAKISYGAATDARCRPERVDWADIDLLGIAIAVLGGA